MIKIYIFLEKYDIISIVAIYNKESIKESIMENRVPVINNEFLLIRVSEFPSTKMFINKSKIMLASYKYGEGEENYFVILPSPYKVLENIQVTIEKSTYLDLQSILLNEISQDPREELFIENRKFD